jgi:hypothetical protein
MATTRGTSVRLVMFDEVMYRGHGIVRRWMNGVMRTFGEHAVARCPKRSGDLASTIGTSVTTTGPRQVDGEVHAGGPRAPYVDYVLKGTTWPIMSDKAFSLQLGYRLDQRPGYLMPLPAHNEYAAALHYQVRGQEPQNFLYEAWEATGRKHRAIAPTANFPGL